MTLETRSPDLLLFGTFEVDLRTRELRKQGVKVRLQELPFQILVVLLQRPGQLVGREELRSQIWPSDTFVDFDNSLNTSINKLREALGDSADSPRFIETLPRRGYRFLVPVITNEGGKAPVPGRVAGLLSRAWRIVVVIGPEGGLTVHEVERAREHGFTTVGLGPYLLRTETAAIVLMGIVRYSLGELEPSGEHG